jgi:Tol biopolymer transport system component
MLTDAAIERALAPSADVVAPADFTEELVRQIASARRSRLWWLNPAAWARQTPRMTQLFLILLLLLVLAVGAIAVASLPHRAFAGGNVIVASGTELLTIDPATGDSVALVTGGANLFGVTRSNDGSLISFWANTKDGTTLEVIDGDGGDRHQVAMNVTPHPIGQGQIDVWSPDNRWLAAGVVAGGDNRILLVDISSGEGKLIGPVGARDPLWSPDGRLLAFDYKDGPHSVLAVMHPDGSDYHTISGDLGSYNASGANNWSNDGAWVYFGVALDDFSRSNIYRANVEDRYSDQLTNNILSAAPALSPDGTTVAYSDWKYGMGTQNLMLMDADGANQRLLLTAALNYGWSSDGEFLLTEWRPPGGAYELMMLRPDGTDQRPLMTVENGCSGPCFKNLGWGQPRP